MSTLGEQGPAGKIVIRRPDGTRTELPYNAPAKDVHNAFAGQEPDERAEIIAQHADYVSGGFRYCSCGQWSDERRGGIPQHDRLLFARHVLAQLPENTDAVIRELGLREEWAPADIRHDGYVDPDTQWTYDRRADAEKRAAPFDQAVATRYVTDWKAAE